MKISISLIIFLFTVTCSNGQNQYSVTFNEGGDLAYFTVKDGDHNAVRVSHDGKVLEWGREVPLPSSKGLKFKPRLQKDLPGVPIEFYGAESDSINRGKLKKLGRMSFFYEPFFLPERGKLRSANTSIHYNTTSTDSVLNGKISSIGAYKVEFYSSSEEKILRGRLKSIDSTVITYYSGSDEKFLQGRVKSIGSTTYTWRKSIEKGVTKVNLVNSDYRQYERIWNFVLREGF